MRPNNIENELADSRGGGSHEEAGGEEENGKMSADDEEDEGRAPQIQKKPMAPTKAEVEEHEVAHFPPRAWCRHCMAGHCTTNQHRGETGRDGVKEEKLGVTISMDYCFVKGAADEEDGISPQLAVYDNNKCAIWMIPVEKKGVVREVVDYCQEVL